MAIFVRKTIALTIALWMSFMLSGFTMALFHV